MAYYDVTITWRTRVEVENGDPEAIREDATIILEAEIEDSIGSLLTAKYEIQEVN